MKFLFFFIMFFVCMIISNAAAMDMLTGEPVNKFPFYVYSEKESKLNHFTPSGFMGDIKDIKNLEYAYKINPKKGANCIRIEYLAKSQQGEGWAGIYWQNPKNNWGNMKGGYNLSKAKKIYFYARGEKGGETVEFKFGGISGNFSDTASDTSGMVELTKEWKQYEININGLDLSYINGGFCVIFTMQDNPQGCIIYIDEVYYQDSDSPLDSTVLKGARIQGFPFYVYQDNKSKENKYIPGGIMGDSKDVKLQTDNNKNVKDGKNSVLINYQINENSKNGWVGIYWQNPEKNWGQKNGGYDLTGAKSLVFYARGEKGGETAEFTFGGIAGKYSDSTGSTTGNIKLTSDWKEYKIDLTGLDLSYINGGFCVVLTKDNNSQGAAIYLDSIYYSDK